MGLSTEQMIAGLSTEEQVRAVANYSRYWFWLPRKKGDERFSLTTNEKVLTAIGSFLVPATIYASKLITESYQNSPINPYHIMGNDGVPPNVEFGLEMALLGALVVFAIGPVNAYGRLQTQRVVNWWRDNKRE